MELVKTLPDVFEEFSEQRRNSFMPLFEMKEKNIPFVGTFCTYTPNEIIQAAGAVPVGLCSFSDETIPDAEQDLPRNLCPLVKSSYGFAKTQKSLVKPPATVKRKCTRCWVSSKMFTAWSCQTVSLSWVVNFGEKKLLH